MRAGGHFIGYITLGERVRGLPLVTEELEMLKTIGDQAAAGLLNLRLSGRLQAAKEMEAFQTISALFVHDLKNLASKLSLLMQNFSVHYDNPEFRADALHAISQSVEKLNTLCGRLSVMRQGVEIDPVETDLNDVVSKTIGDLKGLVKAPVVDSLNTVPRISMDPAQIQKVLTNLFLNAGDATQNGGDICVTTGTLNGWVVLTVSDTGCGMSKAFVDQSLFRPFQTTKDTGTGIGLFHAKMIVEAHQGRLEVESEEGKGTTFRVLLPIGRA